MYDCFLLKVIFFIWKSDGRNCTLKGISFNHLILSKHTITMFSNCKSSYFGSSLFWVFFSKSKPIVLLQACVTRWEIGSIHTYFIFPSHCTLTLVSSLSHCQSQSTTKVVDPSTEPSVEKYKWLCQRPATPQIHAIVQIIKLSEMICDINQYRNIVWLHVPSLTDHFC